MLSTLIFVISIGFTASVAPDRHVRVAHDGEPVAMSVQSDGSILKVQEDRTAPKPAKVEPAEEKPKVEKKLEESKAHEATIKEVKSHATSAAQKDSVTVDAQNAAPRTEIKPHTTGAKVGDIKLHDTESAQLPEGVVLFEMAVTEPMESWKSAFFFFACIVLIVILVGAVVSGYYFNREQAAKKATTEKVSLTKDAMQAPLNDSSSTSDSGEKIAMLFDRVRKSLEDLSDKTPAEQADVAGGQSAPGVNQI
eukprot:gnl/MRDRNA2_/MRDRNA2_91598_c0_seq1.p1 gnl/MRDRNA2_/MRDRNA2_91598_c0~~gnl/MRDRNA2_/MRDRNA2_91598_c0_seq1.p1  ORF type:complete len:251 (+),score=74.30 gnl/MRDRNA2_/MRDRNA2_91598_c0_seq1:110-862(+)